MVTILTLIPCFDSRNLESIDPEPMFGPISSPISFLSFSELNSSS